MKILSIRERCKMLKEIETALKQYIKTVDDLIDQLEINYQHMYRFATNQLADQYLKEIDELYVEKWSLEIRLRDVKIEWSNLSLG